MQTSTGRSIAALALFTTLAGASAAQAQSHSHDHGPQTEAAGAAASASNVQPTDGEIRRIDSPNGKLTIRHAEIRHLDMPPMTMVFDVDDKALLASLKVGDRVRFYVEQRNGKMVVTRIEPQR